MIAIVSWWSGARFSAGQGYDDHKLIAYDGVPFTVSAPDASSHLLLRPVGLRTSRSARR